MVVVVCKKLIGKTQNLVLKNIYRYRAAVILINMETQRNVLGTTQKCCL